MINHGLLIAALAVVAAACAPTVGTTSLRRAAAVPAADLAAIDATIRATYDVITGPPGQKRDFDRLRSLFAPGARMQTVTPEGLRGGSVDDYIKRNAAILEKDGFFEQELGRRVEVFGDLANVWSSYDGRTANGSFHERGINSFQLVKIEGQWKVASLIWQEERKDLPLPADMLMTPLGQPAGAKKGSD